MSAEGSGFKGFAGRGALELIVIVAGVLIALWIEGWREARVDAETEAGYLSRLEADLVADSIRLHGRQESESRLSDRTRLAMDFSLSGRAPEGDTAAVVAAYHFAGFINFFRPQSTTWDDLVATGNLALLRDRDLRDLLGRYYASPALALLNEMDDNRKEHIWYRYRPALEQYFPMGELDRIASGDLPETRFDGVDFDRLRADAAVIAGLKSANGLAGVYRRNLAVLQQENAVTLAEIR